MMKIIKKKPQWDPKKALKVSNTVNLMADMIVKDIKDGITKHSEDIHGRNFAPLSPNTIASKQKKGYPLKPLLAEGKMKEVYVRRMASKTKPEAIIGINKRDRLLVSGVHQEGTSSYIISAKRAKMLAFETAGGTVFKKSVRHSGVPQREWFGFSKRVKPKLKRLVQKMLNRELRI